MKTKRKKPSGKLTPNEKHLLEVIADLRGLAYDGWTRLRLIAAKLEPAKTAAPIKEVLERERQLGSEQYGAGLPWFGPEDDCGVGEATRARWLTEHRRNRRRWS